MRSVNFTQEVLRQGIYEILDVSDRYEVNSLSSNTEGEPVVLVTIANISFTKSRFNSFALICDCSFEGTKEKVFKYTNNKSNPIKFLENQKVITQFSEGKTRNKLVKIE